MNLFDDLGQLARYVRDRIRHGRSEAGAQFDRERGVETAHWTLRYEPSPVDRLEEIFAAMPFDPAEFTFCDLGCGKGRVLLVAAEKGFRRVVGVEVDESLYRTALRNAESPAHGIEVFWMDAAQFPMPRGPLVLFLFNPFDADVLGEVLAGVGADRERNRPLWIVYLNPIHGDLLDDAGFEVRASGGDDPTRWVIYQGLPFVLL